MIGTRQFYLLVQHRKYGNLRFAKFLSRSKVFRLSVLSLKVDLHGIISSATANQIEYYPGRLIHKYSDERRKAVRRSTSAKTLESCFGTHPSRMLPRPFGSDPSGTSNGRSPFFLVPEVSEKPLSRFETVHGSGMPTSLKATKH